MTLAQYPLGSSNAAPPWVTSLGPAIDPIWAELERRAIESFKQKFGPYFLGGIIGLLAWNIYVTRKIATKIDI